MNQTNDFIGSIPARKNAFSANSETLSDNQTTEAVQVTKEVKKPVITSNSNFKAKEKIEYKMATFRLPASKIIKLKELSEKRDTTQAELVNYALDKLFNELIN
jgi:hypothetical protein